MDSQLVQDFKEATSGEVFGEDNYKLVPWISWDDWSFVRESLFSPCSDSVDSALRRISAWRSRGCLPVMIEVTASIREVQQKDSSFKEGLSDSDLLSEDMSAMLYCMTIMRFVNGVVERTREKKNNKQNKISIAKAADVIGIPRMLIDIRHECSHRDLPSLRLARIASTKALDWLKSSYWEPQRMAIPYPSDRTANLRKEIESKIRELALSLNMKPTTGSISPAVERKHSKKGLNKALKNVVKLYSSFSSEVVSVLIEFLLKQPESTDSIELLNSSQVGNSRSYQAIFDERKPLLVKISNKEPEVLLNLLKAVLQMVETQEALKGSLREEHLKNVCGYGFRQTEQLSCLFVWLVGNLKDLKPSCLKILNAEAVASPKDTAFPKSTLRDLIRKCLAGSSHGNNHLTAAALILAQLARNDSLVEKLNKLASCTSNVDATEEIPVVSSEMYHTQLENSIREAAYKLELFRQKLAQRSKVNKTGEDDTEKKGKWNVAKSWKPCPIGMLPCEGSSGVVPVLDIVDDQKEDEKLGECNEKWELNQCGRKREADRSVSSLGKCEAKKLRVGEIADEEDDTLLLGVKGQLMVGGVWKRVTQDELINIASAVRILV